MSKWVLLVQLLALVPVTNGFQLIQFSRVRRKDSKTFDPFGGAKPRWQQLRVFANSRQYEDGEVGEGRNWIEKSFPVETEARVSVKKVDDYDLGISGDSFQTGKLSKRMFEAIISKTSLNMSDEIRQAFTLCAMDFTAKEAARAALAQNGLEMALQEEEEDQGMWGDVEAVRLYDEQTGIAFDTLYDSLEEAVTNWAPGQPFDFVARQVPAKVKELSVEELLKALDPDGALREEAKSLKGEDANLTPDEEALFSIFDDDTIASLSSLATYNVQRVESAPQGATIEGEAFAGDLSRGYRVIRRSDLLQDFSANPDGTENEKSTDVGKGWFSLSVYCRAVFSLLTCSTIFGSNDARDERTGGPWCAVGGFDGWRRIIRECTGAGVDVGCDNRFFFKSSREVGC